MAAALVALPAARRRRTRRAVTAMSVFTVVVVPVTSLVVIPFACASTALTAPIGRRVAVASATWAVTAAALVAGVQFSG